MAQCRRSRPTSTSAIATPRDLLVAVSSEVDVLVSDVRFEELVGD
jgi:hypothetical protein